VSSEVNSAIPSSLNHLVGQKAVIAQVSTAIDAAFQDGSKFDHSLLVGAPGLGKSQLAAVIAEEMAVDFHEILGQSITGIGDLNALGSLVQLGEKPVAERLERRMAQGRCGRRRRKRRERGVHFFRGVDKPQVGAFRSAVAGQQRSDPGKARLAFERQFADPSRVPGDFDLLPAWIPLLPHSLMVDGKAGGKKKEDEPRRAGLSRSGNARRGPITSRSPRCRPKRFSSSS